MSKAMHLSRNDFINYLSGWNEQGQLTLTLLDLDNFKTLNDTHGHEVGDRVLERVTRTLEGSLSEGAYVSRLGGDEFAVAFPGASPEEVLIQMEEIRQHLAKKHPVGEGLALSIPICVGIASFPPHVSDPKDLIKAADEALHRAKREGKGRVAIYVEDKMVLKSNYYSKAQLARLAALSERLGRTEAALLREALGDLLDKYRDEL